MMQGLAASKACRDWSGSHTCRAHLTKLRKGWPVHRSYPDVFNVSRRYAFFFFEVSALERLTSIA